MKYFIYLALLFSISCGKEDKDNIDNVESGMGGRCYLSKDTVEISCITFSDSIDVTTNSATCQSVNTASSNYNGHSYSSGANLDCQGSDKLGSCTGGTITYGDLNYYSTGSVWNATTAQADCTSVYSGTWTAI